MIRAVVQRLVRALRWLVPSLVAACAGGATAGLVEGLGGMPVGTSLVAAGFVAIVLVPVLAVIFGGGRIVLAAWRPGDLAAAIVEDGGAMPRLAGWLITAALGLALLAVIMWRATWFFSSHAAFRVTVVAFLYPLVMIGSVLLLVGISAPTARLWTQLARALDARWRARGHRTALTPRTMLGAITLVLLLGTGLAWRLVIRPRIGTLDLSPLDAPFAGLVVAALVATAWPRLERVRRLRTALASVILVGGILLVAGAVLVPLSRPELVLEIWGEKPLAGLAIEKVYNLEAIRAHLSLAQYRPVAKPGAAHPDIILITIDTVRADHFSTYGYARKTTPNLDALAADGTVFEQGWAHAPSTRYSMPAILTGRLPLDVHYDTSVEGWPGIALAATTIAEALQPLGFLGGGITNYWYFDRSRHMDQGMAEYDNDDARLHQGVAGAGPEQTHGSSSKEQTDKAIGFIDRHAADRWFLWVHYYDPHYAYEPHADGPQFGSDRMALYDGEIAFTDQHIGRLIADLKTKGLYDKTVIVVTGDHGEGFGEHHVELHGYHLYEAQTKVPLIIRVPGLAPRRAKTPAGHIDILPTLVNLAGGKATSEMMGQSLVGELAGVDQPRVVFQQLSYEGNHEMRAGIDGKCHVIYNVSPDTSWEVYRVDRDPGELSDLASDDDECADTRHAVERWYDREMVPHGAVEALLPARPPIAAPLDVDLGPAVRLLAVDLPPTAKPGESVTVTWTFEARAAVSRGWRVFAHLDGPNHAMVNGDHSPARPFEWWKPGQFIRYTTTLVLPRNSVAGTYTLDVGLFHGNTRAHASAPHSTIDNDAVAVATIQVVL